MFNEKELCRLLEINRERPWYEAHENLHTLIYYMVHEDGANAKDILDILEEPWKWWKEFEKANDLAAMGWGCFSPKEMLHASKS